VFRVSCFSLDWAHDDDDDAVWGWFCVSCCGGVKVKFREALRYYCLLRQATAEAVGVRACVCKSELKSKKKSQVLFSTLKLKAQAYEVVAGEEL
jgi:hypothetical protein